MGEEAPTLLEPPPMVEIGLLYRVVKRKLSRMSFVQMLFALILIAFVIAGNSMQILGLNAWLKQFDSGSFTTLAVSTASFGGAFLIIFIIFYIVKRPDLRWCLSKRMWILVSGIALMDTLNSVLATYATTDTPEVLQALFNGMLTIYTCIMQKYLLHDSRRYTNKWVICAFFFIVAGVLFSAVPNFLGDDDDDGGENDSKAAHVIWSIVFCISVPMTALMNVWQAKYMEDYTDTTTAVSNHINSVDAEHLAHRLEHDEAITISSSGKSNKKKTHKQPKSAQNSMVGMPGNLNSESESESGDPEKQGILIGGGDINREDEADNDSVDSVTGELRSDDTTVKVVMLTADTVLQFFMTMLFLPLDGVPYWNGDTGPNATYNLSKAVNNLKEGVQDTFEDKYSFLYWAIFSGGFVLIYIGNAYLNQYSVTLGSMVGQMSFPVTAILLVINPVWNVNKGNAAWYWEIIATLLMAVGTIIYWLWEEMSSPEGLAGCAELKEEIEAERIQREQQQQYGVDTPTERDALLR